MPIMPFMVRRSSFAEDSEADKDTSDITSLISHGNRLYSGSEGGAIKVWDEDLKLLKAIPGHSRSIFSLVAGNDTLYSCSNDGTVKSWSLDTLQGKGTILIDQTGIVKLCFADETLFAGENDGLVRLFVDDKLDSSLNFNEPMNDMLVKGDNIYMMRDMDLVIADSFTDERGQCPIKKSLEGRSPMCFAGDKLCFASRNGKDILVHECSPDLQFKLVGEAKDAHSMIINTLCAVKTTDGILLFSGGWDRVVIQWKISGHNIIKLSTCPVDMFVNVMAAGPKGELFVGGSDGHIVRMDM